MDYLDSAGLESMLAAYHRLSQTGGRLSVATGANSIRNLFDLLGLSSLPELYLRDSLESAEQALLDNMERPS
jgi:anti-anti-sigma regulatory factor